MTSKLYNVVQCAIKTFKDVARGHASEDILKPLQNLVDDLTFSDINLPARLFSNNECSGVPYGQVEYLSVYENEKCTIGIFILKGGAKLPIHDHPGMTGLLKVLHGQLEITAYDVIDYNLEAPSSSNSNYFTKPLLVTKHPSAILNASDKCSILTPKNRNIHEVRCITGPAAFLDILSPPYDSDMRDSVPRACHYFSEVLNSNPNVIHLVQIPCPGYNSCDGKS